jgi:hypothetical protein
MQTYSVIRRKAISLLGAFSILVLAVPALNSRAPAQTESRYDNESRYKDDSSSPIEGSWILANERINQAFTFSAAASFTAGGVWRPVPLTRKTRRCTEAGSAGVRIATIRLRIFMLSIPPVMQWR